VRSFRTTRLYDRDSDGQRIARRKTGMQGKYGWKVSKGGSAHGRNPRVHRTRLRPAITRPSLTSPINGRRRSALLPIVALLYVLPEADGHGAMIAPAPEKKAPPLRAGRANRQALRTARASS
jgi:hypothetical protein